MNYEIDSRKCAKQSVTAVIMNKGKTWVGSNWCENPQEICPRKDMPSGVGYELCKDVCKQRYHAEVDACMKAGENARGGTLYLMGHTYCCDDCKSVMSKYGIEKIVIGEPPKSLVLIESPYAGDVEKNLEYARKCMNDCFIRGEYPFASHLLYTQKGILDDNKPEERRLGIQAGLEWGKYANKTVVYTDLGITKGMEQGIKNAKDLGRIVEMRRLK